MPWLYEWCKNEMFKDLDETDNKDIPVGHRLVLKEQDPTPWVPTKSIVFTRKKVGTEDMKRHPAIVEGR